MEEQKINKINSIIDGIKSKLKFLECDGSTRVLDYLLTHNNIDHTVMLGTASLGEEEMMHYWIIIDDMILDMKSKMWFGDKAEEGLFKVSKVKYEGKPIKLNKSKMMFDILTS